MNPSSLSRLGLIRGGVACVASLMLVTACGAGGASPSGAAASAAGGTTLAVVATTTVFADIVKNVGGDRVSVTSIIPAGAGPEDYEPKPDDAKKLAGANLIVSNGVGLDGFLDKLITAAGEGSASRLVLGDGIPPILIAGEPNPHFWLDPSLVADHYVPSIVAALSKLDPAGAATYQANATDYVTQVSAMDAANKTKIETIPAANRKLVTFHDAFPYFARHYGFELIGVILANVGQEPSASDLAALVQKVKAAGVKAVFSEAQFSPELAHTLAQEAGITSVVTTLYNDTLGPPPADTYLKMMAWNVDQIVSALK
ncbi:MAG: zinc/manganese transport system substrate-binding protein [Chloroflexota bacterium]|nr:zinc/manganese transport system substrate-binding protein [Chloroflexota bacterium]